MEVNGTRSQHSVELGLAALLAALGMVSPFSIDTFFPSFRAISQEFALSDWQVQQTLTAYLVPYALMALVQGPLSDALGRRPVILAGLMIYTAASIACTFAPNFGTLIAFRMVQGMSAGVGFTVGRAIIRDLYDGPQAQRLMSLIMMIFGIAPALAPILGGWIHVAVGWRGVFGFLMLLGLALTLASYLFLRETHPAERRVPLHFGTLVRMAGSIVAHREFLLLAVAAAAAFGTITLFIGAAPAIIFDHWHLKETQFAWLFAPSVGGMMLGAWASGRLAGRIPASRQMGIGFGLSLTGAGLQIALHAMSEAPPIWLQQLCLMMLGLSVQLLQPVLALRILDLFPRARGSAASVHSCVMLIGSTITFGVVPPLLDESLLTLATGSLVSALVALGCWRVACAMHVAPRH